MKSYRTPRTLLTLLSLLFISACAVENTTDLTLTLTDVPDVAAQVEALFEDSDGATTSVALEAQNTPGVWQATATLDNGEYDVTFTATNGDSQVRNSAQSLTLPLDEAGLELSFISRDATCDGADLTALYDVQGSGTASALDGQTVSVEGIVSGDFQLADELSGFFMRSLLGDGDVTTSDGLFITDLFDADTAGDTDVDVDDLVQLRGTVAEIDDLTQLVTVENVTVCADGLEPLATEVILPVTARSDFERYEGMPLSFSQTLTVSQTFFQGRYGQITLSQGGRLYHPNNGTPLSAPREENLERLVYLDDGMDVSESGDNPVPVPYLSDNDTLRSGDTVDGLVGVLGHGQIGTSDLDYRLHPIQDVSFTRANARTDAPEAISGELRVVAFNVLNYFTTFRERGAFNADELERQSDKIVPAILALDADIVGLIEIENNGSTGTTPITSDTGTTAIDELVTRLNDAAGSGVYTAIADPANLRSVVGGGQPDAIKQAIIYRADRVTPVGSASTDTSEAFTVNGFSRRPVAQTFVDDSTGGVVTVVVNHFKSKSCRSASGPDEDQGQGCYNATRVDQAEALLAFIDTLQTQTGDSDVLVIGDLNAYGGEDPIVALENGGLVDQLERYVDPAERYTYTFSPGESGYLDHALATSGLNAQLSGATVWHINADEPPFLDYSTPPFKPDEVQALYTPTPYRSSDHDPVLVGLDLSQDPTPSGFELTVTPPAVELPSGTSDSVTVTVEPFGDFSGEVTLSVADITNLTASFDPNPTSASSTLTLTADAGLEPGTYTLDILGTEGETQAATALALTVPAPAPDVWFNEISYDNDGGDEDDFIELAAPVGTDMSAYGVLLVNGNGNAAYAYAELVGTVSGTNADSDLGFFVLTTEQSGSVTVPDGVTSQASGFSSIQNGDPDGVLLVDAATGTVIDGLFYEATTAPATVDGDGFGPAASYSSALVDVTNAFDGGDSGQSIGQTGSGDSDVWEYNTGTPGALNVDQSALE